MTTVQGLHHRMTRPREAPTHGATGIRNDAMQTPNTSIVLVDALSHQQQIELNASYDFSPAAGSDGRDSIDDQALAPLHPGADWAMLQRKLSESRVAVEESRLRQRDMQQQVWI